MTEIEQQPRPGWRSAGGLPLAAGLIVLAVAATLLAIRAGDDDPKSGLFVRATDAATSQGTYRFTMKQGVRGQGRQTSIGTFGMQGAVDIRAGVSRFVTSAKGTGFDVRCTQIATKDTLYTSVHPTRREAFGVGWVRSDTGALLAGAAFQFRPDQLYRDPDRGFKNLKRSGNAEIRGVRTTRYAGNIDFASFFTPQRASPRPTSFDVDLPAEIFVDDSELIHRITFEVRSEAAQGFSFRIVMDFFDYGKPVNVKLPPAAAVKTATAQEMATACFPIG